ncbi:hypothetical protein WOSG25_012260 [Weissella oryzae SG25]|uniref:Uncharacterized protein n=1 Tax=Weissella oryzae (strain DSM 25784 / JCM 18191 / LMG 30913 / SG25) TaxID=1329250 RepID=A0A069CRU6_WEIOS|nr:hypothetical protein [Weissella oryzae]GAK30129.1 hypothetical protein WOSG25_012260 [Weissella oryzae SG25]
MVVKKDKSQEARAEYQAKIKRKEIDIESFQQQQKSFEQSTNGFNATLNSAYGSLREIHDSERRWGVNADKQVEADARKASEVARLVREQNEQISQYFKQAKKQTLNEIDQLEKARQALPWD